MLLHYYQIIMNNSDSVIEACIDKQRNIISVVMYHTFVFQIRFFHSTFTVEYELNGGNIISIIGGRDLSGVLSDENILETINYLKDYSRKRMGYKFFEGT